MANTSLYRHWPLRLRSNALIPIVLHEVGKRSPTHHLGPPAAPTAPRATRYHSSAFPEEDPFPPTQSTILSHSLTHVPTHGFSEEALLRGARDAGYLDVSLQLFPRRAFDLLHYYRVTRRLALKDRVQFNDERATMGIGRKVRLLALERLRMNADDRVVPHLQDAIALSSLASNLPASLSELSHLSSTIWHLASDPDVSFSWYSKRASLALIYSSTELYMTTDRSPNYTATEEFLDRRLEDVMKTGKMARDVGEFAGYAVNTAVNIGRSWGIRM